MNILYYSVHQILEDDEVRLFQRLGHNVVCLGSNGKSGSVQGFRPSIQFSAPEIELYEKFEACGGFFGYGQPVESIVIPASFMDLIDLVIVMHDPNFIRHFWNIICRKTVVWRTIGQDIEGVDRALRPYRSAGLRIVRYSPMESRFAESLGGDACIRFGKSADMYGKWHGSKKQILTFSNLYRKRYPLDYADYQSIVEGMPSALGGGGNESAPNAIGAVSSDEQIALLQLSCAYLYASGLYIPYTLNFIEAWLTGIPVVVYAPLNRQGIYFEIDRLVEHGVNGFVCRDVGEARRTLLQLLKSEDLRQRISAAGRQSAISYFDERVTQEEWARFLFASG